MPAAADTFGWYGSPCPFKELERFIVPVPDPMTHEPDNEALEKLKDGASSPKRHAACDECSELVKRLFRWTRLTSSAGTRKLKCSGDQPSCSRCVKQNLVCVYSIQKQMGRPRKRRREEEERIMPANLSEKPATTSPNHERILTPILPYNTLNNTTTQSLSNYDSPPLVINPVLPTDVYAPSLQTLPCPLTGATQTPPINMFEQTSSFPDPSIFGTMNGGVQNLSQQWLDFSTAVSPPSTDSTFQLLTPSAFQIPALSFEENTFQMPTSIQQCSCLPALYLTLTSLQTHDPVFPYSISTLRNATKTAESVLRCPVCPLSFPSALQNVMLLGTLLPVIVTSLNRMLHIVSNSPSSVPPERRTIAIGETLQEIVELANTLFGVLGAEYPWGTRVELTPEQWAKLCRRAVKREIFGDEKNGQNPTNILAGDLQLPLRKGGIMGLIDEMEERQHRWHRCRAEGHLHFNSGTCGFGADWHVKTGELRPGLPKDGEEGTGMGATGKPPGREEEEKRSVLCLQIVEGVRKLVRGMGLDYEANVNTPIVNKVWSSLDMHGDLARD